MEMRGRLRLAAAALVAASAVVAVSACGGGDETSTSAAAAEGSFVGTVEGTDAYIAIISEPGKVAGYLCDGKQVSVWFRGSVSSDQAKLQTREGKPLGNATLSSEKVTGEVSVGGSSHAFTATAASGKAGLYREAKGTPGEAGSVETGWILLADGSQRGTRTSFNGDGKADFAPALSSPTGKVTTTSIIGSGSPG
jgi:hypothetical protein